MIGRIGIISKGGLETPSSLGEDIIEPEPRLTGRVGATGEFSVGFIPLFVKMEKPSIPGIVTKVSVKIA